MRMPHKCRPNRAVQAWTAAVLLTAFQWAVAAESTGAGPAASSGAQVALVVAVVKGWNTS